jgi:hypothetical protein
VGGSGSLAVLSEHRWQHRRHASTHGSVAGCGPAVRVSSGPAQTSLPFGPGERVFLVDLDRRQGAAAGIQRVFRVAGLLFLSE